MAEAAGTRGAKEAKVAEASEAINKMLAADILRNVQGFDNTCLRLLGAGRSSTAFKVCYDNTNCSRCLISKVGHKPGDLDELEVALQRSATIAAKGTDYENLVSKFAGYVKTPEGIQILNSFYRDNYGDMDNFMSPNWAKISVPQFASFLVEIFSTLDFLFKKIGFIHMDLKLDNVLIIDGSVHRVLTFGDGKRATMPYMPYSAMVIDFGNAYSWKDSARQYRGKQYNNSDIYGPESEFKGSCTFPGFDVFRFFHIISLYETRMSLELRTFWTEAKKKVFAGFYESLVALMNPKYGMLSRDGCRLMLNLINYGIMIDYESAVMHICNTTGSGCSIEQDLSAGQRKVQRQRKSPSGRQAASKAEQP